MSSEPLFATVQVRRPPGDPGCRCRLGWNRSYRALSYLQSALWVVPIVAVVCGFIAMMVLRYLDRFVPWDITGLGVEGSKSMYQTVITLTLSFLVFTFGSLLVAIQIAGGQLTPRIIATTLLRDNVVRYSVGLFVFTLIFAIVALDRIGDEVHELVTFIAAVSASPAWSSFLFLIDYAARLLRPVSILARVADEGLQVIAAVYPRCGDGADERRRPRRSCVRERADRGIVHHAGAPRSCWRRPGDPGREARATGGVVELVPQVGDFLAADQPLFALYGGAAGSTIAAAPRGGGIRHRADDGAGPAVRLPDPGRHRAQGALAGHQRSDDGRAGDRPDPSAAAGGRAGGSCAARSCRRRGGPRVIHRTPNWEDFVHLSCKEIRACGAGNVQIARRLRAMFENLVLYLPADRHAALYEQLDLLDRTCRTTTSSRRTRARACRGFAGARRRVRESRRQLKSPVIAHDAFRKNPMNKGDVASRAATTGVDRSGGPPDFSLVLGGPLYQLLRRAHLTDDALMLQRRRIVVISLLAWLPLLVLAALGGRWWAESVAVPFLMDVDVHVKFLVAMPLLIAAELVVHQRMRALAITFRDGT